MANINPQVTPEDHGAYVLWETLTAADIGTPITLGKGGAQMAIHALGTFGGTVTVQGSIDGANWFTLTTGPGGDPVTFTAAGYAEIATAARYVRILAGSGVSDVDVHMSYFT